MLRTEPTQVPAVSESCNTRRRVVGAGSLQRRLPARAVPSEACARGPQSLYRGL